jgi:phosphonate transport system permease protein
MTAAELALLRARHPGAFAVPVAARRARIGCIALACALFLFGLWRIDADPARLWAGLSKLGFLVGLMLPPSTGGLLPDLLAALAETLAMAFLGTLLASLAALPLGFLGARNIIPPGILHFGLRRVFDGLRGIDTLIWALIFVAAVGLGPFAGILAIAIPDAGTLAKLFAEAIENIDRRQRESVRAAGASEALVARFGVLPQVLPVMLSQVLYFLESNVRSASILGVVGAGGIGLALSDRLRINNFDEVAFIILLILVTVALIDTASAAIRRRIIRA